MKICLVAQTFEYLEGGGHFWVYLNWALGFHRAGATVAWVETIKTPLAIEDFNQRKAILAERLRSYHLPASISFIMESGDPVSEDYLFSPKMEELAGDCNLLVSFCYAIPESVTRQFAHTALIDIDPGLLQNWLQNGYIKLARYDHLFTISDTIGKAGDPIPTLGLSWTHIPPCVDTLSWPVTPSVDTAPYTTISHWEAVEYVVEPDKTFYDNTKKFGFLPFLTVAKLVEQPMELALYIPPEQGAELQRLQTLGWRVRSSLEFSTTPSGYQTYIQGSRGEFSVCKPSYVKMQSGWISDRTLCYLSSGKPVVVQDTGPIDYLPVDGFLRFRTVDDVLRHLRTLHVDYDTHARAARHLAETVFEAKLVATKLLEVALG